MAEPLLALDGVRAGYGDAVVLDGIAFEVPRGGSLAVLGRNGVGKSTLLLTVMGYTHVGRGAIMWRGDDITRLPANFRGQELKELLPPDERRMTRWNSQPFILDGGQGGKDELAGDEFLLPYWMARYLKIVE